MKARPKHRLLCLLLSVLMIVSLLPMAALAAETETSTWEKVNFEDITADDVVAITMTKGSDTWALPTANTGRSPVAQAATITDGKLTISGAASAFGWSITASGTGHTIRNADGEYLYVDAVVTANDKTKNAAVRIGSTEAVWTLSDENYLTTPDPVTAGTTRYLGRGRFRCS